MQGKAGFVRLAGALLALALLAPSLPTRAQSPEFYQLLHSVKQDLALFVPKTDNPVCLPAMASMAKEAIMNRLLRTALVKVVVEPLEAGAKVALGALGVPGLAISTYSLMRCAQDAASPEAFGRCALGEVIGAAGGEGLQKYGVDNLEGALAGWAWDKAYAAANDAWESYGQVSETVDFEAGGECELKGMATWTRRPGAGGRGGTIRITVTASNCKCPTGSSLKQGNFRVNVPVDYTPSGSRQPGFSAGSLQDIRIEATCCGSRGVSPLVHVFNNDGQRTAVVRPDDPSALQPPAKPKPQVTGQPPTTTPQPPATPPATPPAVAKPKPEPVWPPADMASACPECNVYLDTIQQLRAEIARVQQRQNQLRVELDAVQRAKARAEADIRSATAELNSQGGTGGSAFDPSTGLTTESYTQPDGRVRIRVLNARGEVLEESFRERRDLAAAKKQLEDAGKQLEKARADEARINDALSGARTDIARAEAAIRTQQALYDECIERCRRKVLFGEPPMGVAFTPPLQFLGGMSPKAGVLPGMPETSSVGVGAPVGKPPAQPPTKGGKPAVKPKPQPPASGDGSAVSQLCPDCASIARELVSVRNSIARRSARADALYQEAGKIYRSSVEAMSTGAPLSVEALKARDEKAGKLEDDASEEEEMIKQFDAPDRARLEAELQDCLAKCKAFGNCDVEVERVINIVGNNPFDARDPLRESASSSSGSSSSSPSSCSTSLTPRSMSLCAPNACGFSTPISLTVSSGSVILSPLNSGAPPNGAVTFCNGVSNSSNLTILGAPNHRCSIFAVGAQLLIQCQNNGGAGPGTCSSLCQ